MSKYKQPHVDAGDVVMVRHSPASDPYPAIVRRTVSYRDGAVEVFDLQTLRVIDGPVRHVSDPSVTDPECHEQPRVWDYSPLAKRVMALEEAMTSPKKPSSK